MYCKAEFVKVTQGFVKHHRQPSTVVNLTEKSTDTIALPRGNTTIIRCQVLQASVSAMDCAYPDSSPLKDPIQLHWYNSD